MSDCGGFYDLVPNARAEAPAAAPAASVAPTAPPAPDPEELARKAAIRKKNEQMALIRLGVFALVALIIVIMLIVLTVKVSTLTGRVNSLEAELDNVRDTLSTHLEGSGEPTEEPPEGPAENPDKNPDKDPDKDPTATQTPDVPDEPAETLEELTIIIEDTDIGSANEGVDFSLEYDEAEGAYVGDSSNVGYLRLALEMSKKCVEELDGSSSERVVWLLECAVTARLFSDDCKENGEYGKAELAYSTSEGETEPKVENTDGVPSEDEETVIYCLEIDEDTYDLLSDSLENLTHCQLTATEETAVVVFTAAE